ncbi:MAG: hypothetical protein GC164_04105 [Phycisphaera sp.]|nr:hypothetical protein [Phycisphaera sp.]
MEYTTQAWTQALTFLAVLAFSVGTASELYRHSELRRWGVIRAMAGRFDFKARQSAQGLLRAWFARFPLFRSGHSHTVRNAVKGRFLNADLRAFDLGITTRNGLHRHRCTVVVFKLKRQKLPRFILRPEHFPHAEEFPLDPHEHPITTTQALSLRPYHLFGPNPAAVEKLLHPKVVEFLRHHPGWCVEAGSRWFVVYRPDHVTPNHKLIPFYRDAFQVYRAFRLG